MPPTHINFITLIVLVFLASFALVPVASASDSAPAIPATVNFSAPKMEVSVFVNSIDNLDMIKGSYTVDCYLHFRWTDPSIKTANFEFMNGKPASGADSVKMIWENKSGPVMEEWYRARADFSSTPNNMDYPFHSGFLPITIEDADYESSQLTYVPLQEESGIEPEFGIPGWKFGTPTFSVRNHSYPGNTTYSQLTYNIPLTNDALASLLQTIVPPLIFCIIAGLSFLIQVNHPELVHLRYVLTTSMFISAVMYHFGQLAMFPGLGVLKLFDKFMIAVYLFLAVTVIVTTLCYLAEQQWGKPELVRPFNRYGVVFSILLPVVVFWLLFTFV